MAIKCPQCQFENPNTAKFCSECATPLETSKNVSVTKTLQTSAGGLKKDTVIAKKYRIVGKIGEGGMGIVYEAIDTRLERTVALKFLPPELTNDKEAKKRFIQEARAAAALNHSHICTIYEVDEAEEQTFISMEYIKGQSLKDKLESGPLALNEAKDIALQVAAGLKDAHERGIIHRDIKPANIMLTDKGQAKITDFGLAKLSWGADLTKPATIMGTVAYMSPEQARGEDVDCRTDIWSLGAMLYEMLSGERPFQKTQEQALIYAILNDKPTPLSFLRSGIPSHTEQVIAKALAKKAEKRYQNVDDLIQDLKQTSSKTLAKTQKSIAVLPFTNMSGDPEQEYFCDGITEEIINALTHIAELKVIARTSSFMFKGKNVDIREIGKKLGVTQILEGSVRKAGNRLRITAQLINVGDGSHLWSEKYDREMKDIFDIQDEISLAIVSKLKIKLFGNEKAVIEKRYTENLGAYNLYLEGQHFFQMFTLEGFRLAIQCYEQAISKDLAYGLAYVGLADAYSFFPYFGELSPGETGPKAKKYLTKALELDESLAEAHASLARIHTFYDWNWELAEKEYIRALELKPNASIIHFHYSSLLMLQCRHDEAIFEAMQARELDPLSIRANALIGERYWQAGQINKAIETLKKILTMAPNDYYSHWLLGAAYQGKSLLKESIVEFEKASDLSEKTPMVEMYLAFVYYSSGEKRQGEKIFNRLKEKAKREYIPPMFIFWLYKVSGDTELAYKWLKRACEERDIWLPFGPSNPIEAYRIPYDRRSTELLKKMGFWR